MFLSDCASVVLDIKECVLCIDICEASVVDRSRNNSFAASSSDRWHKQQQQRHDSYTHLSCTNQGHRLMSQQNHARFNVAVVKCYWLSYCTWSMADELFPLRCRAYETGNACSLHEKTTGCTQQVYTWATPIGPSCIKWHQHSAKE